MSDATPITYNLTEYAARGGCSCKIAPAMLQEMLEGQLSFPDDNLITGNESGDDAAVYRLNDTEALIATTDFFTPIVDDAFLFGKIAAANALSDVYAMGGRPILALAIMGWPTEVLPAYLAKEVIRGARETCAEAGIPLAGGHSIDSKEPIFGLSVNGIASITGIKRNNGAQEGNLLLLTKPIGTGVLSAALKRRLLSEEHLEAWVNQLTRLNSIGQELGKLDTVTAMTDITGFGLLGHLHEMAAGSNLSAVLHYNAIPVLDSARVYAGQGVSPDATFRNWNAYSKAVQFMPGVNVAEAFKMLPDPQTNGGLLIAVRKERLSEVQALLTSAGYQDYTQPIGHFSARGEKLITIDN